MSFSLVKQAYAACTSGEAGLNLADCITLSDGKTVADVYNTPASLVNVLVRNVFVFGGIILFVMFLTAGFKYVSQGKKGAEEAKSIMSTAVAGFVVMFCAYWIVKIVTFVTGADTGF